MKNKRKFLLLFMAAACVLTGMIFYRRSKIELPENSRIYVQGNHEDGYAYLTYKDQVFVPYCPYGTNYLGACIGYYDVPESQYSDAYRAYVCEVKGYSPDEWIIDVMDMNCREGMIWREVNTDEVPEGLSSEYEWNQ